MARDRVVGQDLDRAYSSLDDTEFQLGAEAEDEIGNEYVFLEYERLHGSLEGVEGLFGVGCDSAYDRFHATCDSNNADAVRNDPKGQFQAQLDHGQFGWAQKKGINRKAITTDGSVAQGNQIMVSTGTRGVATPVTTLQKAVGTALEANTSTTLAAGTVYLDI